MANLVFCELDFAQDSLKLTPLIEPVMTDFAELPLHAPRLTGLTHFPSHFLLAGFGGRVAD